MAEEGALKSVKVAPKAPKVKVVAPAEVGKPVKKKIKIPTNIASYWRAKDKNPQYFVFTPDGNLATTLRESGKSEEVQVGPPVKLFDLPIYTSISPEELEAIWVERQAKFDEIYQSIETARSGLREAIAEYKAGTGTARAVVIANQLVSDEEAKLIENRSAKRWVEMIANPTTNNIDLANRYEVRKIGFDVYQLKQFTLDPQKLLRPLTEAEAAAVKSGGGMEGPIYSVISDETLLGIHHPKEFKVGNTNYFTIYQAILGEVARQQQNHELFQSLLGTRSSRTLRSLTKEWDSSVYTIDLMKTVIQAFAKAYPEFRDLLLKTGDDPLLYANAMEPIFGIGLDEKDPSLQDSKGWRGENLWGQALEAARTEMREKNVVSKPEDEGVSNSDAAAPENTVISREAQDAAKKAAIINARRFGGRHH